MRTYRKYHEEISPEELHVGLLGYGLFNQRVPPIFTSKAFYDYIKSLTKPYSCAAHDYIHYENMRNINIPRLLAIPHPFAYAKLVESLVNNWDKIQEHIIKKTNRQPHKVSKIHIRKMFEKDQIFEMNYKSYEDKPDQDVDLIQDNRYKVCADISNCFPSIYSHSIPWALVGKKKAKEESGKNKWQNKIDEKLRNSKNKETNGILIGPHSSNLISELVLISIDKELVDKKYIFTRHIDDYTCFTESHEKAEAFLLDLSTELKKFELTLNHKKSKILELPFAFTDTWLRKLKNHRFRSYKEEGSGNWLLSLKEVELFLDLAIELMHKENDNSAILNYAIKQLSKKKLNTWAKEYLVKRVKHLCFIYPYLVQIIDKSVFVPFEIGQLTIQDFARSMFKNGIKKRAWEPCCYSVFLAIKYEFKLKFLKVKKESLLSEDCLFMLLAYLYSKQNKQKLDKFETKAIELLDSDFDRYWLFIYEILDKKHLKDEFKKMKEKKITFIKSDFTKKL